MLCNRETTLGGLPKDESIKLKCILRKGADWMQLAQVKDQCLVVVNMVMNLQEPCNVGNFVPSCGFVSFSI